MLYNFGQLLPPYLYVFEILTRHANGPANYLDKYCHFLLMFEMFKLVVLFSNFFCQAYCMF